MQQKIFLIPNRLCETQSGDLAHTLGRLSFKAGRPMLVEHLGGIYLEHTLSGRVLTYGYGVEYNITHVWAEEANDEGMQAPPCAIVA